MMETTTLPRVQISQEELDLHNTIRVQFYNKEPVTEFIMQRPVNWSGNGPVTYETVICYV